MRGGIIFQLLRAAFCSILMATTSRPYAFTRRVKRLVPSSRGARNYGSPGYRGCHSNRP
jgi:hypothetical protein